MVCRKELAAQIAFSPPILDQENGVFWEFAMTETAEALPPTTTSIDPSTVIRVETIKDAAGNGHFRAVAIDSSIVVYLPSFVCQYGDIASMGEDEESV